MTNTATYNGSISNLWHYLQGLSLSASDSQWLAKKLMKNAQKQEAKELYSSYELSLRDLDEGRVYEAKDVDDLFRQCLEEN
ncbi:MAG: hypothetical protein II532_02640 [Bacteroidales bacterium]|nr:hypothetical protein [Bacteroidales bacterium]